jgi:hypothetical protein
MSGSRRWLTGGERRHSWRAYARTRIGFSAGYEKRDPEIDRLLAEPPLPWDDILDDPVIRQRVGKLIGTAMDRHAAVVKRP